MTEVIFDGKLLKTKETKGTVVYTSEQFGTIYVPKLLLKSPYPASISVRIDPAE